MRGGLQPPVVGWAVFEAVEPGSELVTFAGGMAYEARSALRVLGKQPGALYLRVSREVARTGEDVREKLADGHVHDHDVSIHSTHLPATVVQGRPAGRASSPSRRP